MSARKTEMKEEVEGKRNKKSRVRRKINWRTRITTEMEKL